jgi:hypothetical protein
MGEAFGFSVNDLVTRDYLDARFAEQDARFADMGTSIAEIKTELRWLKWLVATVAASTIGPILAGLIGS